MVYRVIQPVAEWISVLSNVGNGQQASHPTQTETDTGVDRWGGA